MENPYFYDFLSKLFKQKKEGIMKTITLNEMKKVLDDTLSDLKCGKIKNENLIFFCDDGIGRKTIIEECFKKHASEIHYY